MNFIKFISGFYDIEHEGFEQFRWMQKEGILSVSSINKPCYVEFQIHTPFYDLRQNLFIEVGDEEKSFELVNDWNPISIELKSNGDHISLKLNEILPLDLHPKDYRELGVKIKHWNAHSNKNRHLSVLNQVKNGVLNSRELLQKRTNLKSTPRGLGIDMHGVCNVKPPCVYCEWDFAKNAEGENINTPFNLEVLDEYGAFYENSNELINCSIGEPFMMRNLDELLDSFGNHSKTLELTTNGQILTDSNINRLLGRRINLYISLDSASKETYAQFRNNTFERVLDNLRRLIAAKGGPGHLPYIYLVFMPMRANIHELDEFVDLCAEIKVDRMILRQLNVSQFTNLKWDRAGYHFDYKKEHLPFEDLVRAAGRATERCERKNVHLSNQMDFGSDIESLFSEHFELGRKDTRDLLMQDSSTKKSAAKQPSESEEDSETTASVQNKSLELKTPSLPKPSLGRGKMPACLEPWNRLYILRRGVMPCCYGNTSIAPMNDYKEAWNGPLMQAIRKDLLKGRFHQYCLRCEACPVVQKAKETNTLKKGKKVASSMSKAKVRSMLGSAIRTLLPSLHR